MCTIFLSIIDIDLIPHSTTTNIVLLEGTMKGDLTIQLDNNGASMACFYNSLVPRWPEEDHPDEGMMGSSMPTNASCTCKVDAYKLSACLQWQHSNAQQQEWQLPVTSCLLGMVSNEMLVLHILLKPERLGFFTYYLPVLFLRDDEDML